MPSESRVYANRDVASYMLLARDAGEPKSASSLYHRSDWVKRRPKRSSADACARMHKMRSHRGLKTPFFKNGTVVIVPEGTTYPPPARPPGRKTAVKERPKRTV